MNFNLMTRGINEDYEFLCSKERIWWSEFKQFTSLGSAAVIIRSDGNKWNAVIGGIPSCRKDKVKTPIRYTLTVEDDCGGELSGRFLSFLDIWLKDIKNGTLEISKAFDSNFSDENVEEFIRYARDGCHKKDEILKILTLLFNKFNEKKMAYGHSIKKYWFGGVNECNDIWMGSASGLIEGKIRGVASYFNYIREKSIYELTPLTEKYETLAILIKDKDCRETEIIKSESEPENEKKNCQESTPRPPEKSLPAIFLALAIFILSILMLLLLFILR